MHLAGIRLALRLEIWLIYQTILAYQSIRLWRKISVTTNNFFRCWIQYFFCLKLFQSFTLFGKKSKISYCFKHYSCLPRFVYKMYYILYCKGKKNNLRWFFIHTRGYQISIKFLKTYYTFIIKQSLQKNIYNKFLIRVSSICFF